MNVWQRNGHLSRESKGQHIRPTLLSISQSAIPSLVAGSDFYQWPSTWPIQMCFDCSNYWHAALHSTCPWRM